MEMNNSHFFTDTQVVEAIYPRDAPYDTTHPRCPVSPKSAKSFEYRVPGCFNCIFLSGSTDLVVPSGSSSDACGHGGLFSCHVSGNYIYDAGTTSPCRLADTDNHMRGRANSEPEKPARLRRTRSGYGRKKKCIFVLNGGGIVLIC